MINRDELIKELESVTHNDMQAAIIAGYILTLLSKKEAEHIKLLSKIKSNLCEFRDSSMHTIGCSCWVCESISIITKSEKE